MEKYAGNLHIPGHPRPSQAIPRPCRSQVLLPKVLSAELQQNLLDTARTSSRCRRQGVGLEVGPDEGSGGLKYVNQEICNSVKCKMTENHRKSQKIWVGVKIADTILG